METETVDFNDLIDSDDQVSFPGFEIAKFSPMTDNSVQREEEDVDDKILRTPENVIEGGNTDDEADDTTGGNDTELNKTSKTDKNYEMNNVEKTSENEAENEEVNDVSENEDEINDDENNIGDQDKEDTSQENDNGIEEVKDDYKVVEDNEEDVQDDFEVHIQDDAEEEDAEKDGNRDTENDEVHDNTNDENDTVQSEDNEITVKDSDNEAAGDVEEISQITNNEDENDNNETPDDDQNEELNDENVVPVEGESGEVMHVEGDNEVESGEKDDGVEEIRDDAEEDFTIEINEDDSDDGEDDKGEDDKSEDNKSDVEQVEEINDADVQEVEQKDKEENDEDDDVRIMDSESSQAQDSIDLTKKTPTKPARMYMLPPSKRKKISEAEKMAVDNVVNGDDDRPGENHKDVTKNDKKTSGPKKDEEKPNRDADADPGQQSFLSFLNLKPGHSSSDQKEKDKEVEEEKQHEFYSRKRLRTRKKVNYAEDVVDDSDEDFDEEEEEEDQDDHVIEYGAKRRRSSGSTHKSPTKTPNKVNPLQTYAKALSNLVPSQNVLPVRIGNANNSNINIRGLRPVLPKQQVVSNVSLIRGGLNRTPSPMMRAPVNVRPVITNKFPIKPPTTIYQSNVKGLFECGICGVFYNTAELFIKHQQDTHATDGDKLGRAALETFRCEICSFVLTNRFAYLEHKRMKHTKQQFQFSCTKCAKTFNYLVDLQKHKETCSQKTPLFHCVQCPAKFSSLDELRQHQKTNHSRQLFHCQNRTCDFTAQTQTELKAHVQKAHMVSELFPCNVPRCARIFSAKEQLMEHQKIAHGNDFIVQYQCMECKGCYSSKTLLAEHQYLHTTDRLKKCDICSREFPTLSQLLKHKDVHVCKGTAQCKLCSRWCFDEAELTNHICKAKKQMHSSRLYFCDVCKKDFRSDEKMFAHRKDHYRYFQCGECFWEADTEEDYFEHREIHSMYTCRVCADEFESEADLETHKKAHDFYVKMDCNESDSDGEEQPVMYLCPNVLSSLSS